VGWFGARRVDAVGVFGRDGGLALLAARAECLICFDIGRRFKTGARFVGRRMMSSPPLSTGTCLMGCLSPEVVAPLGPRLPGSQAPRLLARKKGCDGPTTRRQRPRKKHRAGKGRGSGRLGNHCPPALGLDATPPTRWKMKTLVKSDWHNLTKHPRPPPNSSTTNLTWRISSF
jgi:hypothetical protein